MEVDAAGWVKRVTQDLDHIEQQMQRLGVPIVRGWVSIEGAQCIALDRPTFEEYASLVEEGSICAIDLQYPEAPISDDPSLRDLYAYLRLGRTCTWLTYTLITPEAESEDDDKNDFSDVDSDALFPGMDQPEMPPELSEVRLNELALRVAREPVFGSLRSHSERRRHAEQLLASEPDAEDIAHALYRIAHEANTLFIQGVLPSRAKELAATGKSMADIAAQLGVSRDRAKRAIALPIPSYITKLLST